MFAPRSGPKMGHMTDGKYSIELCREGGPDAGVESVITSEDDLTRARALYRVTIGCYPGRVVLLRDRARILARSDQPEAML